MSDRPNPTEHSLYDHLTKNREDICVRRYFLLKFERDGYEWHRYIWIDTLERSIMHWLSDVLQALCHRLQSGVGVGSFTSKDLDLVDGGIRLPPPPSIRSDKNITKDEAREQVVRVYYSLLEEVLSIIGHYIVDNMVVHGIPIILDDKDHLKLCLTQVLSKNAPKDKDIALHTLSLHLLFQSSGTKLYFVQHSICYLQDNYADWRTKYKNFNRGNNYDILDTICDNKTLLAVYNYRVIDEGKPQYEDNAVGALCFIVNVVKHANERRHNLCLIPWTDDELVAIIEYYSPGMIRGLFSFFWLGGYNLDWCQKLRTPCSCCSS